jgi:chromate transport protein ChrA
MLFLAAFYDKLSISPKITEVFRCLGAAVTGLIVSVGFRLARSEIKNHNEIYILLCAFVLSLTFKLDIVIIVILAGLAGVFFSKDNKKRPNEGN